MRLKQTVLDKLSFLAWMTFSEDDQNVDFNCIANVRLDKIGGNQNNSSTYVIYCVIATKMHEH